MNYIPPTPAYEDMRDGLLQAAAGSASDQCLIWQAFAARGIGQGADGSVDWQEASDYGELREPLRRLSIAPDRAGDRHRSLRVVDRPSRLQRVLRCVASASSRAYADPFPSNTSISNKPGLTIRPVIAIRVA